MENSVNNDQADLAQLEDWFKSAEEASQEARDEGERAIDYFNGIQLTAEEVAALEKRGQPPVKYNFVRKAVEAHLGLEISGRTDPRAFPREPDHEQDAEAVTDALRYVADNTDLDQVKSHVFFSMLVPGFGGAEVVHEQTAKGVEIKVREYDWDRLFVDPFSRKHDFSDARYKGSMVWQDEDDFKSENPDIDVGELLIDQSASETYDDKPANIWADAKRKRIRVILIWYRKGGEWYWCKFIKGQKLAGGKSDYIDGDGRTECPLVLQGIYSDRENRRHGIVRDMFDPQDEINKRRSKGLHQSVARQTLSIRGALDSVTDFKAEMAKPDGHYELNPEAFEDAARSGMKPVDILNTGDQSAINFNLLQEAKAEFERVSVNPVLTGESDASSSGRKVIAQQRGGMVEVALVQDRLNNFTREIYRQMWNRIRQFWTEQKWVRVTDDERNVRFVGLNRPVTLMEKIGQMPEEQGSALTRQLGLVPGDPRLDQPVAVENQVAEIDVDIIIEPVPDRITLAGETYEALLRYAQAGTIPPQVLIEADPSLPADKKKQLLDLMSQPPQPGPAEQLEMENKASQAAKNYASAERDQAQAFRLANGL